jgi:hypothetical protein
MPKKSKMDRVSEYFAELDRVMPQMNAWTSWRYECNVCGAVVADRIVHLRWHQGSQFSDTLTSLFGQP